MALAYIVPHSCSFVVLLATRAMCFAILAMSVDLLLGFTGLSSLGQAAYFGVGAYLTAILATNYHFGLGWDFWLVVMLGMLIGAALAALFGLFAIRASGVYFLMITLALGQCVWGLAYRWNSLTGGDNGINRHQPAEFRARPDATSGRSSFWSSPFSPSSMIAAVRAGALAVRPQPGRHPRARVAHADPRLQYLAAQIHRLHHRRRLRRAWPACCGRTPTVIVSPETVVLTTSVDALLMVVLGGAGTLVGGAIGSAIVFGLREYLSTLVPWWQYVLGGVYVLTILYLPMGLMGIPARIRQTLERPTRHEQIGANENLASEPS